MRKGLVDSMILMDYDNGHEEAVDWWESMLAYGWRLSVSVVSHMECLKGIANISGDRDRMLSAFEARIAKMRRDSKIRRIYPLTTKICRRAHQLLRDHCIGHTPPGSGRRIEGLICDMLIAATVIKKDLVLFTHNERDFEWINGLKVCKPEYSLVKGSDLNGASSDFDGQPESMALC